MFGCSKHRHCLIAHVYTVHFSFALRVCCYWFHFALCTGLNHRPFKMSMCPDTNPVMKPLYSFCFTATSRHQDICFDWAQEREYFMLLKGIFFLSESCKTKPNHRLDGASNRGPPVFQWKYKQCIYSSALFQVLDNYSSMARKFKGIWGKCVRVWLSFGCG